MVDSRTIAWALDPFKTNILVGFDRNFRFLLVLSNKCLIDFEQTNDNSAVVDAHFCE